MFYGLWTGYLWVKYQHFPRKLEQVKKFVSLWNYADKQGTTYILRCEVCKFHEGFEGYTRPEQNVRFRLFFQALLYFYIIRQCTMKWTWVMEQLIGKISMRNFSVLSSRYSLYYCEVCKWHSYYQTLSLNLIKKTAPWFIYTKSAILFVKVRTCSESMYNRKYIWYCSLKISSSEKANHC
jgi:hypothetical protein